MHSVSDPSTVASVESLFFRWRAFRLAGRDVSPDVLCREWPHLTPLLAERIAAEGDTDDGTVDRPVAPTDDSRLISLLGRWQEGFDAGREPTPESLCPDDPALREQLREQIAAVQAVAALGRNLPEPMEGAAVTPVGSRFEVVREVARGGMGRVSEAVDIELNRRVAFKDIQGKFADDPATRGRFVREALITGQLEHPGVIPVYGLGTGADGRPYYAMRFVEGESLKDATAGFHADLPTGTPSGEKAVAFRGLLKRFADVCNAVAFAHSKRIVHRDLKPANVMLGPFGETLVVDWGLARSFADRSAEEEGAAARPSGEQDTAVNAEATAVNSDTGGTQTGQVMGTPAYMSPEQAAGQLSTLGPAWDIYSLGATLYHLLTGRPPYTGKPMGELIRDVLGGVFPPPRAVAPWVPKPLDAVVRKAMAREAKDRYPSALELAAEIDRFLADEPVAAYRERAVERARRWARRHRGWVQAGGAAVLVTFAVLAVSLVAVNGARQQAVESDRLKDGALKREGKANDGLRKALEAEEAAARRSRRALDTVTDEVVGRLLGKQAALGPDERKFLAKVIAQYEELGPGTDGADAARAKLRVAEIYERLGDTAEAAKQYAAAVADYRKLADTAGADHRRGLAAALVGQGRTSAAEAAANAALVEGLNLWQAIYNESPDEPAAGEALVAALVDVADLGYRHGRYDAAAKVYAAVTRDFAPLLLAGKLGRGAAETLARAYDQHAAILLEHRTPPDIANAYNLHENAYAVFGMLERTFPGEPEYPARKWLAFVRRSVVKAKDGKLAEAEGDLAEAIAGLTPLVEQNPAVRSYRAGLGEAHLFASGVATGRKKWADSTRHLVAAHAAFRHLHRAYPSAAEYREALVRVTAWLTREYEDAGVDDLAERYRSELRELKAKSSP